jgi:hypothetical protein
MNVHTPTHDPFGYRTKGTADYARLSAMFRAAVQGANFFTPTEIGYVEIPGGVAEISEGRLPSARLHQKMYGVTVVIDGKRDKEKSACLHSYEDVKKHIEKLSIN